MEQILSWLFSIVLILFPQGAVETSGVEPISDSDVAAVIKVVDGDTIDVRYTNGEEQRVRYIGIDTPEPYANSELECYALEATEANKILVENQEVRLVKDVENTDRYGRLLRYVYIDDVFVNAALVQDGYATALRIKPNVAQYDFLKSLEREAENSAIGMWANCL